MDNDSFTYGLRRIATIAECQYSWCGGKNGSRFKCHMFGHKFVPNNGYRWIYTGGLTYEQDDKTYGVHNPIVCDSCDGDDVKARWIEQLQFMIHYYILPC